MRIRFASLALIAAASPAAAQYDTAPPKPVSVSGSATLISDYRLRGVSQSGGDGAAQGTLTVTARSGPYAGVSASTIHDAIGRDGLRGGYGSVETDLYAGYAHTFSSGLGIDAGLQYDLYPDNARGVSTDFFEPYATLSYTLGPATAKAGANYAWGGQSGLDFTRRRDDSLYLHGELEGGIPTTPLSLKAHVGRTRGSLGIVNPDPADHSYWDWSLGAEAVGGPLRVGVSYVDTDIRDPGGYARGLDRGSTVLGYVGVSF